MNDTTTISIDTTGSTQEQVAVPEFALAMRGYDRTQVDEFISRLERWMDEARDRTEAAEAEATALQRHNRTLHQRLTDLEEDKAATPAAIVKHMGERLNAVMADALHEADELRQHAHHQAEEIVRSASHTAEETIARARGLANDLEEAARMDRKEAVRAKNVAVEDAQKHRSKILDAATREAAVLATEAQQQAAAIVATAEQRSHDTLAECARGQQEAEHQLQLIAQRREVALAQLHDLRMALEQILTTSAQTQESERHARVDRPTAAPAAKSHHVAQDATPQGPVAPNGRR
jgi:DivIVA domain-containing protein